MKNKLLINKIALLLFVSVGLNLFLVYPTLTQKATQIKAVLRKDKTTQTAVATATEVSTQESQAIFEEINPSEGISLNVSYGKLGPKMLDQGVIDLQKFKDAYLKSGKPFYEDLEKILVDGSDETIVINQENSYFLLNFFWAVGLSNKSKILTEGEMMQYGGIQGVGNFASTGGWTLGKSDAVKYYAKGNLIPLTAAQEELVKKVAANIFRPCCNNSTAFPDCNHGMALLGILELMAVNGASEDEMYNTSKYINAYWFPGNYYDLAVYFKNKEGKSFDQIDARILLSKDFSSASGSQQSKRWLIDQGIVAEPPKRNGGCGV